MSKTFVPTNPAWIEVQEHYWVNQFSKWVVRDYHSPNDDDLEPKWVILDNLGMMISCEFREDIADCMEEADRICNEVEIMPDSLA